ncbi:MAG: response regulator [Bacteroidetes bacterium]|nr:response regulator [Bacteroidota bacterium]
MCFICTITYNSYFYELNKPLVNLAVELKKNTKSENIPVIIFSTSTDPTDIMETKELGASGFITKPSKISELTKILKNFIINYTHQAKTENEKRSN